MLIAKKTPSKETSLYMYTNQQASQVQQSITHYTKNATSTLLWMFSTALNISCTESEIIFSQINRFNVHGSSAQ
jgi:hypothetical protein